MATLERLGDISADLHDYTVNGECSNCGQCCSNFLPVGKHEVERIRRYIKKHKIEAQVRRYPTRKHMIDFVCPFRAEGEKKCLIYPVRPAICQDFRCDKPSRGIMADKAMYHGKYPAIDMRATFYGGEPALGALLEAMMRARE